MPEKLALDLPVLLPDALDGRDRCVSRLVESLDQRPGLDEVHVVDATETDPARLCLHYDPTVTELDEIRRLAEAAGAHLTDRYEHVLWPLRTRLAARDVPAMQRAVEALPGVVDAVVTRTTVRAEVDTDQGGLDALRDLAVRLGLDIAELDPASAGHAHDDHDHDHDDHDDHDDDDHGGAGGHDHDHGSRLELASSIGAGVLWVIGFVLELVDDSFHGLATGLFIAAFALAGWFVAREAWAKVRARTFEIDALMLVAAVGAAVIGRWHDAALLLVLFGLGHALEGYAMGRAKRAIEALAELAPDTAVLRDDEREVPAAQLQPGDVILVRPHARVAADGFVVAGASSVDQAALTGESMPVDKAPVPDPALAAADPGSIAATSRVFAGTVNGTGRLEVEVLRAAGESTLAKVAAMVRDAEAEPSPTQRFTDRFQRIFVPFVIGLVIVTFVVGLFVGGEWDDALYRSMAVLVAASPCALALAIPSAVLAGIARAGQRGVLVKGGAALQHLGSVRVMAFDKTGTLTAGTPRLVDVVPTPGVDDAVLLATAIGIERASDHPLARAVVRDASAMLDGAPSADSPVVDAVAVRAIAGRGLVGTIDGDEVMAGNASLFDDIEPALDAGTAATVEDLQQRGRTIVIVRRAGAVLGVLGLLDTPRPGAADAVASMQALGVRRMVVLSGDHQAAVDAIAAEVGVADARGALMPADKVAAVAALRDECGSVAMVGDGVNDAPAMARASVGIAMGAAGSDVALETADVALMGDDLGQLSFAVGIGRRASSVIRQNLIASLGIVFVLLIATITGLAGIGPAVVLHEGSTLLVVANALRLLGYRGPRVRHS